jgi:hypothetical protein
MFKGTVISNGHCYDILALLVHHYQLWLVLAASTHADGIDDLLSMTQPIPVHSVMHRQRLI